MVHSSKIFLRPQPLAVGIRKICVFDGDTRREELPEDADDDSAKFKSNPEITDADWWGSPLHHSGSINVAIYIVIEVVL